MIVLIPHFALDRPDGNKVDPLDKRTLRMVMRWYPEFEHDTETIERGQRAIHSLHDGDTVSLDRLEAAIRFLAAARDYYATPGRPEPYPGRNSEAVSDFLEALSLLLAGKALV